MVAFGSGSFWLWWPLVFGSFGIWRRCNWICLPQQHSLLGNEDDVNMFVVGQEDEANMFVVGQADDAGMFVVGQEDDLSVLCWARR